LGPTQVPFLGVSVTRFWVVHEAEILIQISALNRGLSRPSVRGKPNYIKGVCGKSPQWGPGAKSLVRGQRDKVPLKLTFSYFGN